MMAKIIDAIGIFERRFIDWAREWLDFPDEWVKDGRLEDRIKAIMMAVLLDDGVFTIDEIREEHQKYGIYLGVDVYQRALQERRSI